jgi:hypothetical protein
MVTKQKSGLFVLPIDLRINIYRYLIFNCLDVGPVSEIVGLCSCYRGVCQGL